MLNFASFIKTIQSFANDIKISDEEFVTGLIDYVGEDLQIKVKKKDKDHQFYISKGTISLLLNQKIDVSATIRKPFCKPYAKEKLMHALPQFFDDYMNKSKISALDQALRELVNSDYSIDSEVKSELEYLHYIELFATVFIEAIKANNLKVHEQKELWRLGNNSINLISGDLIKIAFDSNQSDCKIVVIPVNTAFDTQLSTNTESELFPLVSEKTIHGQWLLRMLKLMDKDELDLRIQNYLDKTEIVPVGPSHGINENSNRYPIGTTAIIQYENTVFYLLAISEFDDKNLARSSEKLIKSAVKCLMDYYDELGLGYDIYIPMLGTGKSRAYLEPKKAMLLIKDTFMEHQEKINGNIFIVVLGNTIAELS